MAENATVEFTFDAKGFHEAINSMSKGITDLGKNFEKFSSKSEKSMTTAMTKGVTSGLIMFSTLKAGFLKVISEINNFIPEIGVTLHAAGDIIWKNFLWPLRKALLPILQSILDWTRRNRLMFVQMGTVLVSVLKLVKTIFNTIITLLRPFIEEIKGILKSIFGDTAKSITDTINIALFKISAFIIGLQVMLQPLFDSLGGMFHKVIIGIKEFSMGFMEGIKKIFAGSDFHMLESLVNMFEKFGLAIDKLTPALRVLGEVLGSVIGGALRMLIANMTAMIELTTQFWELVANPKKWKDILKETNQTLISTAKENFKAIYGMGKGTIGAFQQPTTEKTVQDAIITKKGEIIHTSPDDNIIATKGNGKNVKVEINMGNINLNVTEGSAHNAGMNYIQGMKRQIKNIFLDEMILEGGY